MSALPIVEIKSRAASRLRNGHVWVYRSDVVNDSKAKDGDVVQVIVRHRGGGRNSLGVAFYNSQSLITLRLIARADLKPDRAFWRDRLEAALRFRKQLENPDNIERLVFAEADGIPGLIVDRYADVLVIQNGCFGTERLQGSFVELLNELVQPTAIVERNDGAVRKLEGLPIRSGLLSGQLTEPVEISEGGVLFDVHPLAGQKTGAYLDQRENHIQAGRYAHGRCLDVFCYQGGFGLQLAKGGAEEVTLLDQSDRALASAQQAAQANGLSVKTESGNAFDQLREKYADGERFDMVVLDPPAFAKNRHAVEAAERGYKEINLRAMKLLRPGGWLITSSCSYHVSQDHFEQLLLSASQDANRMVQVIERRSQARDHPARLDFPESRYLKCFVMRVL